MPAGFRRTRPELPRFSVAWMAQFEATELIEDFRRRFDPLAALAPAHLTLVFPFPTALTALQVEAHVKRVAAGWPPIPVTFRNVRAQANEFVFLMAARGAASIVGLHDRLYTRSLVPHLRRDLPYEPHITIGRCPEPARLEDALATARQMFDREFAAVIRELALLSVGRDGRIGRLSTFPLNTG